MYGAGAHILLAGATVCAQGCRQTVSSVQTQGVRPEVDGQAADGWHAAMGATLRDGGRTAAVAPVAARRTCSDEHCPQQRHGSGQLNRERNALMNRSAVGTQSSPNQGFLVLVIHP